MLYVLVTLYIKVSAKTILQLKPLFARVTEVVLAVSAKIPFLCFHMMIFVIPFPTFTLPFHPEFSVTHIFQP